MEKNTGGVGSSRQIATIWFPGWLNNGVLSTYLGKDCTPHGNYFGRKRWETDSFSLQQKKNILIREHHEKRGAE